MYVVRFYDDGIHHLACGTPKDLFAVICVLDNSRIEWWEIQDYKPRDFGWSQNGWKRLRTVSPDVTTYVEVGTVRKNADNPDGVKATFHGADEIPDHIVMLYIRGKS